MITRLAVAVRRYFERETNRSLVTRTIRLDLDGFPDRGRPGARHHRQIRLPFGPVSAVTSVVYRDQDGTEHTVDPTAYTTDLTPDVATLTPKWGQPWPWVLPQPGAVSVTYTAGYGEPEEVPEDAIGGMLLLLGHWYANRETVGASSQVVLPMATQAVIDGFKIDLLA
jgi:uncharacterized phiE125 gp8 family phage protein